jgi:hypothetical protein
MFGSTLARFVIVSVWVGLLLMLWQQPAVETSLIGPEILPQSASLDARSGWMGLYMQDRKVGYSNFEISPRGEGYLVTDRSVLRLRVMDTNQTIHAHTIAETDADYGLQSFRVRLQSGVGNFAVEGVVEGGELLVTMNLGTQTDERRFPLDGPIFVPSALRASLFTGGMKVGARREAPIFDPAAMATELLVIRAVGREELPTRDGPIQAWRVVESFRGVETTVWLDAAGVTLREQGPMGLLAVRESAERATGEGWGDGSLVDLMDAVAVPVANPIADPRDASELRLRLAGLGQLVPPAGGRQVFDGPNLVVTREDLSRDETFELPYQGEEWAADMAPTVFVQSDHPRLRETVERVLDGESDARNAAVRIRHWVFRTLEKKPVASIPNALQVLEMGAGDCNEHAVLYAGLARAAGLPSRVVAGVVYAEGVFLYHAWNEVWLGQRWVSVDPAFDQMPVDATHLKLLQGEPDQHVALVPIIGKLSIDVVDQAGG